MALSASVIEDKPLLAARRFFEHVASKLDVAIDIQLWDGTCVTMSRSGGARLRVTIDSAGTLGSLLRRPGFPTLLRLYAGGHIDCEGGDLAALIAAARAQPVKLHWRDLDKGLLAHSLWTIARAKSQETGDGPAEAGDYGRFPHDVGTGFHSLFLGAGLLDSCAHFTFGGEDLDTAQRQAMERLCRRLRLRRGERLLDLNGGWGGLACHAAQYHGVEVVALARSPVQREAILGRAAQLGLRDRVTAQTGGIGAVPGTFTRVVSVGLFGDIDFSAAPANFAAVRARLVPQGLFLTQMVTRRSKPKKGLFGQPKAKYRPILDYAFPSPALDHHSDVTGAMAAGGLKLLGKAALDAHMIRTAALWYRGLQAQQHAAEALTGPVRLRLWLAYLAGLSAAFDGGALQMFELVAEPAP